MYGVRSMVYVRLRIYVYTVLPKVYLYYYICYYTTDVTTLVVSLTVSAAFGETAQPTEMGLLPPFMLQTIVIEEMNDTTLLSVFEACVKRFLGIFTSKDCKFFNAKDVIPHLRDM